MRVRQVMTTRVRTVEPDMTLAELERFLTEEGLSGAPVVEHGQLCGVVTRSDIVKQISVGRALAESALDFYRDFTGIGGPVPGDELPREAEREALGVAERLRDEHVRDAMVEHVISVAPDASVAEAAQLMVEHSVHRVLVVDDGRPVGIVTTLDLARLIAEGRLAVPA